MAILPLIAREIVGVNPSTKIQLRHRPEMFATQN
jgi:hypothetical protein